MRTLRLPRHLLGMRWWLALAFAVVAALTALAVVTVLNNRAERAVRTYAREFVFGNAVAVSEALKGDTTPAAVRAHVASISARRGMALFAYADDGRLLSSPRSLGIAVTAVPSSARAARTALGRDRFVQVSGDGSTFVVAIPVHRSAAAALVAYAVRPELAEQLGVVRHQFPPAAIAAFAIGAAAGLVIASLIALRLARIARAAKAIGEGDFTVQVPDRFPDEVGSLSSSLEAMRTQLEGLFAALRDDRDRLERLLGRLNEGVLLVDRSHRIEFANEQARKLLGAPDAILGARLRDLPHGSVLEPLAADLQSLRIASQTRLTPTPDLTLLVSGVPPSGSDDSVIIVIADESQRERAERAQRDFGANAAHELRTPLATIVSAVEMLQTGAKEDPPARDRFLALIEQEADRLTRLSRALLIVARAEAREEAPELHPVDVGPVLRRVAASLEAAVEVQCPPALAIHGTEELLEQAVGSIAANAARHAPGGTVRLTASASADGRTVVAIADDGPGIPVQEQGRVFERFYRGDRVGGGFGLGLSIARGAVRALGGEIELDSEPRRGTTVRLILQAVPQRELV